MALRFGYYENGTCCTQIVEQLCATFELKFNKYVFHISKSFPPQDVYSKLEAKVLYAPPSSPPCPQTLSTHTLVIVGLLISDALLALFFPPFCLQKEKHIAFVLQVGTSSLLTVTVSLQRNASIYFFFPSMVLLWKVTIKLLLPQWVC